MQNRSRPVLRRLGVALFSVAVVVLILLEDLFTFAGNLLRTLLPKGVEEFLRGLSNVFAFAVVGVALVTDVVIKYWEVYALGHGQMLIFAFFFVFSKVYFIAVVGYLCRVYSDRLLAIGWIRKSWEWYLGAKEYLKSFEWYKAAHAFVERIKERMKSMMHTFRERLKGPSLFSAIRRAIRMNRRT